MISIEAYRSAIGRYYGRGSSKGNKFQCHTPQWFYNVLQDSCCNESTEKSLQMEQVLIFIVLINVLENVTKYTKYCDNRTIKFGAMIKSLTMVSYLKLVTYASYYSYFKLVTYASYYMVLFVSMLTFIYERFIFDVLFKIKNLHPEKCIEYDNKIIDGVLYSLLIICLTRTYQKIMKQKVDLTFTMAMFLAILTIKVYERFIYDLMGNSNLCPENVIDHRDNTLNDLELYNLAFLKLAQLLVDGDVESDPGPVTKGRGGRKAKKIYNFSKKAKVTPVVDNKFLKQSQMIHLQDIKPWTQMYPVTANNTISRFQSMPVLNDKISFIQGDITKMEIDAIVNAAKTTLLGGGGIDGAIHDAAGKELKKQCEQIKPEPGTQIRCRIGECKVTIGCKLNCKHVFHTVGPKVDDKNELPAYEKLLVRCYENCLQNVLEHNIKSIVFPCISTGIYNYDNKQAAHVALNTVRLWLELNQSHIERVVFCTYKDEDFEIYKELMCEYFPTADQCVVENDDLNSELNDASTSTKCQKDEVPTSSTSGMKSDDNEVPTSCTTSTKSQNDDVPIIGIDRNIDYSVTSDNTINGKFPVLLQNEGVNVCFINSIVQVMYSLPCIHTYLEQTSICDNVIVTTLRNLFRTMRTTNEIVQTSPYVRQLNLSNYTFGRQHDAQEALSQILDGLYPDNNQSIFRIKSTLSIVCERNLTGCGEIQQRHENTQLVRFQVNETHDFQRVENILIESFANETPEDYICRLGPHGGCGKRNTCSRSTQIDALNNVLIIQLLIFTYDDNPDSPTYGGKRKKFPNFIIDQTIDRYSLQGIIWHDGHYADSGHYTAMIKHNADWYHISDSVVLSNDKVKFYCTSDEKSVPYLLIYTKNNTNDPISIEMNYPLEPESLIDFSIHHEMSNGSSNKRSSTELLDEDKLNSAKRSKLDLHEEIILENEVTSLVNDVDERTEEIDQDEIVDNGDVQPVKKTYAFNKRKRKFTHKKTGNN